jgi:hypothetical protein
MAFKYLSHLETLNIDMQGYELQNAVVHSLTTATRPASPTEGQIIYNQTSSSLEVYDGSNWVSAAGDITAVTAGAGLSGGGASGSVSVALDYAGADNFILAAGAGSGDVTTSMKIAVSNASDNVDYFTVAALPFTDNTGTVTSVSGAGTVSGLTLTGSVTTSGSLTLGGALTLTSAQVIAGLGYTPYNSTNPSGFTDFDEPGIYSGGGTPTLAPGVSAAEIRTLIGAGTSSTSGTVTSVAAAGNDGITVSGSPITAAGTITLGLSNGGVSNAKLANSSVTFGSTAVALGATSASIAGLTGLDFVAGDRSIGASIGANDLTLGAAASTVVIPGNLTVSGTTTSINSNEVNIGDAIIKLNADEAGAPSQNAGFEVERGTSANVSLVWDESADRWDFGAGYDVRANAFIGDLEGNADTASAWATGRTITLGGDAAGSVSIDGTANVTLTVSGVEASSVKANSVALGTDTTGNYVKTIVAGEGIDVTAAGEGADVTVSAETASATNKGIVELATSAEAVTGTDSARAVTPAGANALVANRIDAYKFADVMPAGLLVYPAAHGFGSTFGAVSVLPIVATLFDQATGEQVMAEMVQVDPDNIEIRLVMPHANNIVVALQYVG